MVAPNLLSSSPVLSQLATSLTTPAPSILVQHSRPALNRRIDALLRTDDTEQLALLRKLRIRAMTRSDLPRSAAFASFIFGPGAGYGSAGAAGAAASGKGNCGGAPAFVYSRSKASRSGIRRSGVRKPKGELVKQEPEPVASVSRSGRAVKTPSKFKQQQETVQPYMRAHTRMRLQQRMLGGAGGGGGAVSGVVKKSRSGRRPPKGSQGADADDDAADEDDDEALPDVPATSSEVCVGDAYQADVPAGVEPASCLERGDTLVWSAAVVGPSGTSPALEAYLDRALPHVGGPPQRPPTAAAAQQQFGVEMALTALHEARGDVERALSTLATLGATIPAWSKVEERQFRHALSKASAPFHPSPLRPSSSPFTLTLSKERHDVDLLSLRDAVRTKDLASIVRFFYVEEGLRKAAEREKQRELDQLRQARATQTSALSSRADSSLSVRADSALSGRADAAAAHPANDLSREVSRSSTPLSSTTGAAAEVTVGGVLDSVAEA